MNEKSKATAPRLPGENEEMVCFRCGLCCRYRVCMSADEAHGISDYTELPLNAFVERYEEQGFFEESYEDIYWFEPDIYLLRQRNGECFFLEHTGTKRTRCLIHPAKPQVCQKYVPNWQRAACQEGLATLWQLAVNSTEQLEGTEENLKAFRSFMESLVERKEPV